MSYSRLAKAFLRKALKGEEVSYTRPTASGIESFRRILYKEKKRMDHPDIEFIATKVIGTTIFIRSILNDDSNTSCI